MDFELIAMSENDIATFKKDIQEAFQKGFEAVFGKTDETVLPEKDIDRLTPEKALMKFNVPGAKSPLCIAASLSKKHLLYTSVYWAHQCDRVPVTDKE